MIEEEKREHQKKNFEQIYQIVNDLKNKIRQFEEKLKDVDINFSNYPRLFDFGVINTEWDILSCHNEDEEKKIESDTDSNLITNLLCYHLII